MREKSNSLELWVFSLLLLLTLAPIFLTPHLIGMDSQTHLYNARIILDLLTDKAWASEAFVLQDFPVPNWTGHAILAFLLYFMDAVWAEKIHLSLLLVSLALSFRAFVRPYNLRFPWIATLLSLSLMWSWFVLLGFFNFLWGMVFFLMAMRLWLKNEDELLKVLGSSLVLGMAMYFSHPTWLMVATLAGGLWWLIRFIHHRRYLINGMVWAAGLIPSWWMLWSFISRQSASFVEDARLPFSRLWNMLYEIFPLVVFHGGKEGPWLRMIVLGGFLGLISHFLFRQDKNKTRNYLIRWSSILMLIFLLAFLYFPDVTNTGSFISSRLMLIAVLFLFLVFGLLARNSIWSWIGSLLILVGHFALVNFYRITYSHYSDDVASVIEWGEKHIPDGSTAVMLNRDIWFEDNLDKALGYSSNVILLDNFEAWTGYFPVVWREDWSRKGGGLRSYLGDGENSLHADYLLVSGSRKDGEVEEWRKLYQLVSRKGKLELYKRE